MFRLYLTFEASLKEGVACGETADRCRRRLLVDEALFTVGILFELQALQMCSRLATFLDEVKLQKIGRAAAAGVVRASARESRVPLQVDLSSPPVPPPAVAAPEHSAPPRVSFL